MTFLALVLSLLFTSVDTGNPPTENPPANEVSCPDSGEGNDYIIVDMYNP